MEQSDEGKSDPPVGGDDCSGCGDGNDEEEVFMLLLLLLLFV
jgi:hypothetical protein